MAVLSFRVFVILDYFEPNLVEGAKVLINVFSSRDAHVRTIIVSNLD